VLQARPDTVLGQAQQLRSELPLCAYTLASHHPTPRRSRPSPSRTLPTHTRWHVTDRSKGGWGGAASYQDFHSQRLVELGLACVLTQPGCAQRGGRPTHTNSRHVQCETTTRREQHGQPPRIHSVCVRQPPTHAHPHLPRCSGYPARTTTVLPFQPPAVRPGPERTSDPPTTLVRTGNCRQAAVVQRSLSGIYPRSCAPYPSRQRSMDAQLGQRPRYPSSCRRCALNVKRAD
jgi:hypothetical protein